MKRQFAVDANAGVASGCPISQLSQDQSGRKKSVPRAHLLRTAILWIVAALLAGGTIVLVMTESGRTEQPSRAVPQSREAVQYSFAPVVRRAAPAVVNVYVSSRVKTFASPFARHPFFRRFFGREYGQPSERMQSSLGSGVIVSADGVIVTNAHVINARGKTEIRVALSDKREFDARVLATDEKSDIAIIKIANSDEKFPFLQFENSDNLEVGDLVLAIGNPFGVGQTVTSGIVSGLARTGIGKSDSVFIQTDAAINPGNSGGALVDVRGRLVGINTAIFSRSGGSHGIGFAIPSNLVRLYVDSAISGREVAKPWIGARLKPVNRELAEALQLTRIAGALVERVYDDGPAAAAGLEPGDVIVRVDDFSVEDDHAVLHRLTLKGIKSSVKLTVIRKNKRININLNPTATPILGRNDVRNLSGPHPFDGARVANILPHVAEELELNESEGVVVLSVRRGSAANRLRLRRGDIIVAIGNDAISDLSDLETILSRQRPTWTIVLTRNGRLRRFRVRG
ncbi:MAG: Do family serine endopeptidase [Hyphomicrobiaceae bacterium]